MVTRSGGRAQAEIPNGLFDFSAEISPPQLSCPGGVE